MLQFINQMTLRKKGFSIVLVATVSLMCTAFIARNAISQLNENLTETAEVAIPQLKEISHTFAILQGAHLEVVRTGAVVNTGLTGEPMQRQFQLAREAIQTVVRTYEFAEAAEPGSITAVTKDLVAQYIDASVQALSMLEIEPIAGTIMINTADQVYSKIVATAEEASTLRVANVTSTAHDAIKNADRSAWIFTITTALSVLFCLLATSGIIRSITAPIKNMTDTMKSLAQGDMDVTIAGVGNKNEIGEMASAVSVFRDNALEAESLREDQEKSRLAQAKAEQEAKDLEAEQAAKETERARAEMEATAQRAAQSKALEGELARVIDAAEDGNFALRIEHNFEEDNLNDVKSGVNSLLTTVDDGLRAACLVLQDLASGNLRARMSGDFKGAFADLQKDTNSSADQFEGAIIKISESAVGVLRDSEEIASAATSLSNRTEKTAASLEETSAAIEELTTSVKSAAEGADQANSLVKNSMEKAQEGETIVTNAIQAMDEIAEYSRQISETVEVINKIAFQTNLLALNAGVEAARAGETGRGFSVVASEVRALAVQAAASAEEIEQLINRSSEQVNRGVGLVGKTGSAIKEMSQAIEEATHHVSSIAESARQQAEGISNVNLAVTQIDQATQQNAAMFEETTAASLSLSDAASALTQLAHQFETDAGPSSRDNEQSVEKQVKNAAAVQVKTTEQTQPTPAIDSGWEEF